LKLENDFLTSLTNWAENNQMHCFAFQLAFPSQLFDGVIAPILPLPRFV
jgi:hypothetical protein